MNYSKLYSYTMQCLRQAGAAGLVNMGRGYLAIKREPDTVRYSPQSLVVEPTLLCNLKCLTCDAELRERTREQMTLAQFEHIIGQFPYLQRLNIQGVGEPIMNPAFFDMVKAAKSRGIYVYFNTNGTLLNQKRVERLVDAEPDLVRISVDGADRDTYEHFRVGARFDEVMENIRRVASSVTERTTVGIWFLAMKENLHQLPLMPELARSVGVGNLFVQTLHSWGREELAQNVVGKMGISREKFLSMIDETRKKALENNVVLNLVSDMFGQQEKRLCPWPWFSTYVTVEGHITPCCVQGANPEVIKFGNIHEESFKEIWNNKKYQAFRRALKSDRPPRICIGCPSFHSTVMS